MNFAVIVPCFNEEHRLDASSFLQFVKDHPNFSFLMVNDGSTDGTQLLLEKMQQASSQISLLSYGKNRGKGEAVRLGMQKLLTSNNADYLAFFDADSATPLSELLRLSTIIEEKSVSCLMATRFLHLGSRIERRMLRHYLGRIFATAVSIMLVLPVYDTQCGCKFFAKDNAAIIFSRPFVSAWFFDVECLFRLKQLKLQNRIIEVPLAQWIHRSGSKLRWYDFLKAPWELSKIFYHYVLVKN